MSEIKRKMRGDKFVAVGLFNYFLFCFFYKGEQKMEMVITIGSEDKKGFF